MRADLLLFIHIILLQLSHKINSQSTPSSGCIFCNSNNLLNSQYLWKKVPSDWNLSSFSSHQMAISYKDFKTNSYVITVVGGIDYDTRIPSDKVITFNITLNPPSGNLGDTFRSGVMSVLSTPYNGHSMVRFPGCLNCRAENTSISNQTGMNPGILLLGSYTPAQTTQGVPAFTVTALIVNPSNLSVQEIRYPINATIPSYTGYGRHHFSAVHTTYFGRQRGFSNFPPTYDTAGSVVIFGGWTYENFTQTSAWPNLKDVWAFHLPTEKWELLHNGSGLAPSPRNQHNAVSFENKMIVFGGNTGDLSLNGNDFSDETWIFYYDTLKWEKVVYSPSAYVPSTLVQRVVASTETGIVLFHGGVKAPNPYNTLDIFDINRRIWIRDCETREENVVRFTHSGVVLSDEYLLIFGGLTADSTKSFSINSTLLYDIKSPLRLVYCKSGLSCMSPSRCLENNPITCSNNNYLLCSNNTCVSSPKQCTSNNCPLKLNKECPNGICTSTSDDCAPFPRCPPLFQRCVDGSCALSCPTSSPQICNYCTSTGICTPCCSSSCSSNATIGSPNWINSCCLSSQLTDCCPYNATCCQTSCSSISRCIDGTCQSSPDNPCPGYNGCTEGKFQCPTGNCVSLLSQCQSNCLPGEIQCADGSCVSMSQNCTKFPDYWSSPNYYIIKEFSTANIPNTVPLDKSGTLIRFLVTQTTFTRISAETENESIFKNSTFDLWNKASLLDNPRYYSNIWSPVYKISYWCAAGCSSTLLKILGLYLPYDTYRSYDEVYQYSCLGYFNQQSNTWTCTGKYVKDTSNLIVVETIDVPITFSGSLIFALIRNKWDPPTALKILQYFNKTFDPLNIFGTTFDASGPLWKLNPETLCAPTNTLVNNTYSNIIKIWIRSQFNISLSNIDVIYPTIDNKTNICIIVSDAPIPQPDPQPAPPPLSEPITSNDGSSPSMLYLIIGIVIGSIILCVIFALIIYCCISSKMSNKISVTPSSVNSRSQVRTRPIVTRTQMSRTEDDNHRREIKSDQLIPMNTISSDPVSDPKPYMNESHPVDLLTPLTSTISVNQLPLESTITADNINPGPDPDPDPDSDLDKPNNGDSTIPLAFSTDLPTIPEIPPQPQGYFLDPALIENLKQNDDDY